MLFPGEWHKYEPGVSVGWNKYWIGFQGDCMETLVKNRFFYLRCSM
ncbi:MAG: AraC family ligand binding domain-containing protein [Tannerellaceae bacterium]|nr:AraC family ligand binding domain-containing protein [Tannerellaceae bacterium]